jgi:hypothetical protein
MIAPPSEFYPEHETEVWILFDCRVPGTRNRLYRERRAWGPRTTVENLGHGCAALMIRPGGAQELAR